MPTCTVLNIPQEEQTQMLAALRHARYGYLLDTTHQLPRRAEHVPALEPKRFRLEVPLRRRSGGVCEAWIY